MTKLADRTARISGSPTMKVTATVDRMRREGIDVIDVMTGKVRRTIQFELASADQIGSFSVHPDGKQILLQKGGLRYDLWMAEGFAQRASGWRSWFRHWEIPTPPAGEPHGQAVPE